MKRISILFAVLFAFSCVALAQTPFKAHDQLSAATSAVSARASDAYFVEVLSSGVDTNGRSATWSYGFYSPLKDSVYDAIVVPILGVEVGSATRTGYAATRQARTDWVNSDIALAAAESNGGKSFRASNPNATITMTAGKGFYPPDTTKTVWLVEYSSSGSIFVAAVNYDGTYLNSLTSVNEAIALPGAITLEQNYPNPFSSQTAISFTLNTQQNVTLAVYNQIGEQVATLLDGRIAAGAHSISFDASNLPEGVYFYKLTANGVTQTHRMMVVK